MRTQCFTGTPGLMNHVIAPLLDDEKRQKGLFERTDSQKC